MQATIRSKLLRRSLILFEVLISLALLGWIAKIYVANELATKPTVRNLEQAVRLDPGNTEYLLRLARLYEYDVQDIQPERAAALLRRAVELNPFDPQGWLDLAAVQIYRGNTSEAEVCLQQADSLAPFIPAYQWPIGNFYLLQGNVDQAFRHFKVVLAETYRYDQILFSTAWKATGDAQKILQELIPERTTTEINYLNFLVAQKHLPETQAAWKRILASPGKFRAQECSTYLDALIDAHQPEQAYQVWMDMAHLGLSGVRPVAADGNLVNDGDFEDEIINGGFSWRVVSIPGVFAGLDTTTFHSPGHSFLVQFPGDSNLDYSHLVQYVKVSPDRLYRLQGFVKTEGITTDSGPRLEVFDAYNSSLLDRMTEDVTGTTNDWVSLSVDFKTGAKTDLVLIRLRRLPSRKLDNRIAGRAWLDDVRLIPLTQ